MSRQIRLCIILINWSFPSLRNGPVKKRRSCIILQFIYYQFCQKTGLYKRISLQTYSPQTNTYSNTKAMKLLGLQGQNNRIVQKQNKYLNMST